MASSLLGAAHIEIGASTKGLVSGLNAAKGAVHGFGAALKTALGPITAIFAVYEGFKEIVGAAMEGEEANVKLATALKNSGQEVDSNVKKIGEFADALQSQTTYGDEAIKNLVSQGMQLGLTADESQQAAKAAVGLSTAYGMDVGDAMLNVSKEMQGVESRLKRQIPALNGVSGSTARLAIISKGAADGMKQEQAKAQTTAGTFTRLKEILSDVAKAIGNLIIPVLKWCADGLVKMSDWVLRLNETCSEFGGGAAKSFELVGSAFTWLGDIFTTVFSFIGDLVKECVFQFLNWEIGLHQVGLQIKLVFMAGAGVIDWFAQQSWAYITWFFNNFGDIAKDTGNYIWTIFKNLGDNIGTLWKAALEAMRTGSMDPLQNAVFKSLTAGFKSAVKEGPKMIDMGATVGGWTKDTEKELAEWDRKGVDARRKFDEAWKKAGKKKKLDDGPLGLAANQIGGNGGGNANDEDKDEDKNKKAGESSGLVQRFNDIQKAILQKNKKTPHEATMEDTAKKQLEETKKTSEALRAKNDIPITY